MSSTTSLNPSIYRWLENVSAVPPNKCVLNCRIVMVVLTQMQYHRSEVLVWLQQLNCTAID
jgi:hypothetical protein